MKVRSAISTTTSGLNGLEINSGGEEKLRKASMRNIKNEARLWLFKNLLMRNLATPDIYFFIRNQMGLRNISKKPRSSDYEVCNES